MRLKSLRKVMFKNTKRGCMEPLAIDQEFTLDSKEDATQIFELISMGAVVPIDPEFIPERAKYLCLYQFPYQLDGVTKQALPQEIIQLSREEACRFMASGHCRPSDLNAWTPKKLLEGMFQPDEKVKVMFDLPEERPENWATKGVKR